MFSVLRYLFVAVLAACILSGVPASAQMPSKAEMRQQMLEAGMTPEQVETAMEAVASFMPPPEAISTAGVTQKPMLPCEDENENRICDEDEDNPETIQCLQTYVNIVEREAQESYGDELGKNALRVAQTCSTAVIGGTMYYGYPGGPDAGGEGGKAWYTDMDKMLPISGYWKNVIAYARHIYGPGPDMPDFDESNFDFARIDEIMAGLPPALQSMLSPDAAENIEEISKPIHKIQSQFTKNVKLSAAALVRDIGQVFSIKRFVLNLRRNLRVISND